MRKVGKRERYDEHQRIEQHKIILVAIGNGKSSFQIFTSLKNFPGINKFSIQFSFNQKKKIAISYNFVV